jgi:membrane protease YdiL (CAAX protease family)
LFYHVSALPGVTMNEPSSELTPSSSAPIASAISESALRKIFLTDSGLRAGWRVALYLAGFIALAILFSFVLRPLVPQPKPDGLQRWVLLLGECIYFAAAIIPAFAMARLERRSLGTYGLPGGRAFGALFWHGVVWGLVAITVLLLVLRGVGVFHYGSLAVHGVRALKYAAFWALLFLLVGLAEEFLVRGYTQFTLGDGIGFWPAAVVLSCIFGGLHLKQELALGDPPRAWAGVLGAAAIGLFFCLTLRRTGSLWFAIGMHASWDWGESFLYSVPDSGTQAQGHLLSSSFHGNAWLTGGPVGPEASLLLFVLIAIMWLLFDRMYPAKRAAGNSSRIAMQ